MTATTSTVVPPPAEAPTRSRGGGIRPAVWQRFAPLIPAIVLLLLFFAGPVIWSVYTAFTDQALTGSGATNVHFIGLQNFSRMFADATFWHSIVLTIVFVLGSAVIGQNTLGLAIALLMRGRSQFVRNIVGLVVIGAWVMPEIVAAFCWYAFLNNDGSLNEWLKHVGFTQDWLYSAPLFAVILTNVWRGTAFSMMVYSAALSDIPNDIEEQAAIDGAGGWNRLRLITLPMIRRSIMSNLMLITLQTLAVFTTIFVLTAGGPGNKSQTTPLYMYEQAFKFSNLAYGTAMALILLLVGALFSVVYITATPRDGI